VTPRGGKVAALVMLWSPLQMGTQDTSTNRLPDLSAIIWRLHWKVAHRNEASVQIGAI